MKSKLLNYFRRHFWSFLGIPPYKYQDIQGSRIEHGLVCGDHTEVCGSEIGMDCIIGKYNSIKDSFMKNNVTTEEYVTIQQSHLDSWIKLQKRAEIIRCKIGSYSYLSTNARAIETSIGKFCSIASNTIIGCGDHPTSWPSTSPTFYSPFHQVGCTFASTSEFSELESVSIGNDCWVGANAVIRNGVNIGNGAIIAAGGVVTKNVPDYAIVGGVPAKIIRFRFDDKIIKDLLSVKWWDFPEEVLLQCALKFRTIHISEFLIWAKNI